MAIHRHTASLEAALGTLSGFTDMLSAENFVTISAILPVVHHLVSSTEVSRWYSIFYGILSKQWFVKITTYNNGVCILNYERLVSVVKML